MDPRKWSRGPKKAMKETKLESRLLSLLPAHTFPRELEQSRFWFCKTEVRLSLFLTSSMVMPMLLAMAHRSAVKADGNLLTLMGSSKDKSFFTSAVQPHTA